MPTRKAKPTLDRILAYLISPSEDAGERARRARATNDQLAMAIGRSTSTLHTALDQGQAEGILRVTWETAGAQPQRVINVVEFAHELTM